MLTGIHEKAQEGCRVLLREPVNEQLKKKDIRSNEPLGETEGQLYNLKNNKLKVGKGRVYGI